MATTLFPRIRTGTDDFKNLLLHSDVFVDKSLLIKELLEESSEVILITRPRRWGKSLNMSMIKRFFEIEVNAQGEPLPETERINPALFLGGTIDLKLATGRKKLLQKLQIASCPDTIIEYQGKFPVILCNLKDVKGSTYQEIEEGIGITLKNTYNQHSYLLDSTAIQLNEKKAMQAYLDESATRQHLKQGLRFLSELLYKHFNQKVYMLIDEYDTPINHAYIKFG
ncbi:AAA family ATPase, partial [Candidatus Cardinium hertigii]